MKKVLLVSATQKDEASFWTDTALGKSAKRQQECKNIDDIQIVYSNSKGLCEVYNQFLTDEYKDYIIIFAHDDIVIQEIDLKLKLNDAIQSYDIVGVAGTSKFSLKSPVVWHNSPRETWSGAVAHPQKDGVYVNSFGIFPKRCMVVDGLFIAVNAEKVLESGVKWDERFTFHFYDLSFCVDSHLAGLEIGTWDIPLTHFSHGDYNNETWRDGEVKFIEKYAQG